MFVDMFLYFFLYNKKWGNCVDLYGGLGFFFGVYYFMGLSIVDMVNFGFLLMGFVYLNII